MGKLDRDSDLIYFSMVSSVGISKSIIYFLSGSFIFWVRQMKGRQVLDIGNKMV